MLQRICGSDGQDSIYYMNSHLMDVFNKFDIKVFDVFIEKFAKKYVDLRSSFHSGGESAILKTAESLGSGFDLSQIKSIIAANSVYLDPSREQGVAPAPFQDIFRSDLGELLTTYYFEEKLPQGERYIIPLKNISYRERYDMPGRGNDVLGYRISSDGKINLLLGEAKVSSQTSNPPNVVDRAEDSVYNTQKSYHDSPDVVLQRLTDYIRRISNGNDLVIMGLAVIHLKEGRSDKYDITYGCGLVRDYSCVKEPEDYGKMKTNAADFKPGNVHFAIFSFSNETIDKTVQLFYEKVRELING